MSASRTFLKLGVWLTELSTANTKAMATSTTTSVGGSGSVSGASPLKWMVEKPACTRSRRLNALTRRAAHPAMDTEHRGYRCIYEKMRKSTFLSCRVKAWAPTNMCVVACRKKRQFRTWLAVLLTCKLVSCSIECDVGSYRDGDGCEVCQS